MDDPPAPRPLQISSSTVAQIFSLAESLDNFRSIDLNSRHKVANMGLKTLIYQSGPQVNKVQYNYTEIRSAQQLTELCAKIGNVLERISELEYAMKYDPLGLPQILRQIEEGLDENEFVDADLMSRASGRSLQIPAICTWRSLAPRKSCSAFKRGNNRPVISQNSNARLPCPES